MSDTATVTVEAVKKVYFHSMPSVKMHTKTGAEIVFVNHRFITDDPGKQDYLDGELKARNPNLSTKPYVDGMDDPVLALKNKMREEIIKEEIERIRAATQNPNRDMGESKDGPLNVQSSKDIAPLAIGATTSGGAQLMASLAKK